MIWEEILKIGFDNILQAVKWIIIIAMILKFIEKKILPKIPDWIHAYNLGMLERTAIKKADEIRNKHK